MIREIFSPEEYREQKRSIRRAVLARRDALSGVARQRAACLITERLLGHQWFYRSRILLCYVSYGSELDTHELIQEALRLEKEVYLPKVLPGHQMEFFRIEALDELQPGFHGIPEPPESGQIYRGIPETEEGAVSATAQYMDFGQALMVMPGVAYDPCGHRLGYGGGYYDRYLPQTKCPSMLLCRHQLERDDLPVEAHDVAMDYLVTERGITACGAAN